MSTYAIMGLGFSVLANKTCTCLTLDAVESSLNGLQRAFSIVNKRRDCEMMRRLGLWRF